ncbi:caspase a-like isoform X2 [Osmerus mordax]|uniref:caspase a-like isoform X2 n=1 Tax=Osmerus mordax TaxID=8014 RepID=UPI0035109BB6
MAAELSRVRTKFIEKVSKALTRSLLDDLLEARALNQGESEEILEDNCGRRDQARCLIDIVRKKGDHASNQMIDFICGRDELLQAELGLSQPQPQAQPQPQPQAQPQAQPQSQPQPQPQARPLSSVLIPSLEKFKADILQSKEIYHKDPRDCTRLALLITNIKFAAEDLLRRGAERDEENMEVLLRGLGYQVVKLRNLSGQQMDDAVRKFSQRMEHTTADSTFVVIMSHGKLGQILGVNHDEDAGQPDVFPVDNIFTHLNTKHCKDLRNKPKVIIIQACRGEKEGSVMVSDTVPVSGHDLEEDSIKEHKEKDFISILSSTPDTVSFRHKEKGSLMIQYIVETFNTYACDKHISELFTRVMRRFEAKEHGKCQMPSIDRCTLVKEFYLFPGL